MSWLEFAGIADMADVQAANLPFGKGRLLEIARAMAWNHRSSCWMSLQRG